MVNLALGGRRLLLSGSLFLAACFRDVIDAGQSNCQVQSVDDNWTNNGVRVLVRQPY